MAKHDWHRWNIPLSNDGETVRTAVVYLPSRTISEKEWGRLQDILATMKPCLVSEDAPDE